MAWTTPMTFTANTALTASQLNTYLRDNLNVTEVAVAQTPGSMIVSTGSHTVAEFTPGHHSYTQVGYTSSTSYTNLNTGSGVGPTCTLTTGTSALVLMSAQIYNSTSNASASMSYAVSGATTVAAADQWRLMATRSTANTDIQLGTAFFHESLTAGENTFQCKYKVGSGTGYFQVRRLSVFPF